MPQRSEQTVRHRIEARARPTVAKASHASRTSIEAVALAGFAHVVLILAARLLFLRAPSPDADNVESWYLDASNQRWTIVALNTTVIGVIAFLWFVAVVRRRVGERENRFFGTVFIGSTILLTMSWLLAAILYTAPALSAYRFGIAPGRKDIALWQAAGTAAESVLATRLEAVFIMSMTSVGRLSGAFRRPLVVLGYVVGLVMMLVPLPNRVLAIVFPIWVLVVSATMLVRRREIAAAFALAGART